MILRKIDLLLFIKIITLSFVVSLLSSCGNKGPLIAPDQKTYNEFKAN